MSESLPTQRKRVLNVGRWRIAFQSGSRYRPGIRIHDRAWFDFALPFVVVSAIRRKARSS